MQIVREKLYTHTHTSSVRNTLFAQDMFHFRRSVHTAVNRAQQLLCADYAAVTAAVRSESQPDPLDPVETLAAAASSEEAK